MIGRVAEPRAVDVHGFEAALTIERALVGDDPPGTVTRIAWEELARGAKPRLADGSHVVVALDPLPTQSLWRERFPDGAARVIAGRGSGILPAPSEAGLAALVAFLTAESDAAAAVTALAELVTVGSPSLALAAIGRLGDVPDLGARLTGDPAESLVKVVRDAAGSLAVRTAVLELAGSRELETLRPALAAALESGPPLDVTAWYSLAALDGRISPAAVAALADRGEPALRILALRHARGTPTEARVATAVGADPAPSVRAEGVRLWCDWRGVDAVETVEPALFDGAPEVRGAAAEGLGGLGEVVVPRLEVLVAERTGTAASGPLLALRYAGPQGQVALNRLMTSHPDPGVRKLATFIAGKPLVDH